jgi:XTP/dITP diphosphohydrolase
MGRPQNTVLVASNNEGKISEILDILNMDGWQYRSLRSLGIIEMPEETGETYEENARIKARAVSSPKRSMAILADDSGLEVDALSGAPGVRSARYGGVGTTDQRNVEKLLAELEAVPESERTARFICCIVYMDDKGHEITSRGVCEGRIALAPRGLGGFGYDPVFLPDEIGGGRTMAELSPEEKNRISHRGRALRSLREKLFARHDGASQAFALADKAPPTSAPAPASASAPADQRVRLVVFDFDGTLLEGHSPVEMTRELLRQGIITWATALKALWWGVRYRLRLPVEQKTVREYIFKSFSHVSAVDADMIMAACYRDHMRSLLRPQALEALKEHQTKGDLVVLVSASFSPILREVLKDVGAYRFICTQMEIENGFYTGAVQGHPPEGAQKVIQLSAWADAEFSESGWVLAAAYGDHRSDEPLLSAAQTAVAVSPDTGLERAAKREGWRIVDWSLKPSPNR